MGLTPEQEAEAMETARLLLEANRIPDCMKEVIQSEDAAQNR